MPVMKLKRELPLNEVTEHEPNNRGALWWCTEVKSSIKSNKNSIKVSDTR
jgi:hypothetical protein